MFPKPTFFVKPRKNNSILLTSFSNIRRETVELLESIEIYDTEDLKEFFSDPNSKAIISQIGAAEWDTLVAIIDQEETEITSVSLPNDSNKLFMYVGLKNPKEWLMSIYWNDLLLIYESIQIRNLVNKFQKIVKKLYPIECYYLAPQELSIYFPKNYFSPKEPSEMKDLLKEYGLVPPETIEEYSMIIAYISAIADVSDG